MENTKNIVTISPNEGRTVSIACGNYRIVISGKDTGGEFSMIEMSSPLLISRVGKDALAYQQAQRLK